MFTRFWADAEVVAAVEAERDKGGKVTAWRYFPALRCARCSPALVANRLCCNFPTAIHYREVRVQL